MWRDVQPSRLRRNADVPENVSRLQCRSLKTLTGEVCQVCHLTTCFLWVRSIIFFLIYPQAWCIAWMFTRPKVTKPETQDRDVISSRPRQDQDIEPLRLRRNWAVRFFQTLETETVKTENTSLHKMAWTEIAVIGWFVGWFVCLYVPWCLMLDVDS